MAPKKSTKNPSQAITEALDTPLEATVFDTAVGMGLTSGELRERLAAKLDNDDPLDWETVPAQHEPLIEQIARDLESEASVRRLTPEPEEAPQLEPPVIEEQPKSAKGGKLAKTKSTKLTQVKVSKLKESDEKSKELNSSNLNVNEVLHARKGQKNGARLATIELTAEDITYRKIKSEGLKRKTAQLTSEIAAEEGLDPIELLKELGLDSNSEILNDLRSQIEPALGKLDSAVSEIVDSAWLNGINLDAEFTALSNLLNSEE